jgi:hypothetical protein
MNKLKNTYANEIKLEAQYSYDKDYKKVYNIKELRKQFNNIIKKLK